MALLTCLITGTNHFLVQKMLLGFCKSFINFPLAHIFKKSVRMKRQLKSFCSFTVIDKKVIQYYNAKTTPKYDYSLWSYGESGWFCSKFIMFLLLLYVDDNTATLHFAYLLCISSKSVKFKNLKTSAYCLTNLYLENQLYILDNSRKYSISFKVVGGG